MLIQYVCSSFLFLFSFAAALYKLSVLLLSIVMVHSLLNQVSKSAVQGVRWTMEDTFTVANGGHFAAVFDGHGGAGVSGMLRDHVHRLYSKALPQRHNEEIHRSALDEMQVDDEIDLSNNDGADHKKNTVPSIQSHVAAIRGALSRVERESLLHDHFEYHRQYYHSILKVTYFYDLLVLKSFFLN